jgi:membrane protein YdbS with pleckstrin-like domain
MLLSKLIQQKSYERIEYVLRRHPLTFVPNVLMFLVLLAVPFALSLLLSSAFPDLFADAVIYPMIVLAIAGYLLLTTLFFYTQFVDYYLDIWIVTNDRVIDIEQFGLFSRSITEIDLFRLQDVTTDIHGVFATFFKYGNVTLTTASSNPNIVFRNISNPNQIRNDLISLSHEDRRYHKADLGE